jgi:hypothetical protein
MGNFFANAAAVGGGGTALVLTGSNANAANSLSGGLGFEFVVGASNITVTELGRWVISGNSGTHTLRLMDSSGNDLGTVSVNTSGATPGQYLYGTLGTPVVLTAGGTYCVMSDETSGGDQAYFDVTSCTTTAAAAMNKYAYRTGYSGAYSTVGTANYQAGPVNLKYT